MSYTTKDCLAWIEAINEQGRGLTDWEQDFIESVEEQIKERGWRLTDRQIEILERIYTEKTP